MFSGAGLLSKGLATSLGLTEERLLTRVDVMVVLQVCSCGELLTTRTAHWDFSPCVSSCAPSASAARRSFIHSFCRADKGVLISGCYLE